MIKLRYYLYHDISYVIITMLLLVVILRLLGKSNFQMKFVLLARPGSAEDLRISILYNVELYMNLLSRYSFMNFLMFITVKNSVLMA